MFTVSNLENGVYFKRTGIFMMRVQFFYSSFFVCSLYMNLYDMKIIIIEIWAVLYEDVP